jgi:signal transduction histidine kinase
VLAHGGNPKLVGKNLTGMKDSEGNPFFQMLLDLAKTKGKGWSGNYRFMNPATQKLEAKVMYLESIGETYVGVGIYK